MEKESQDQECQEVEQINHVREVLKQHQLKRQMIQIEQVAVCSKPKKFVSFVISIS